MTATDPITRDECDRKHKELLDAIHTISDRLFVDNGHTSHQSRIGRLEMLAKAQLWVLAATVTFWLGETVPRIVRFIGTLD